MVTILNIKTKRKLRLMSNLNFVNPYVAVGIERCRLKIYQEMVYVGFCKSTDTFCFVNFRYLQ